MEGAHKVGKMMYTSLSKSPPTHPPSMNFFDIISARATQLQSLLCVGLDPHFEDLLILKKEAESIEDTTLRFCRKLIDDTRDLAVCFKANVAFFEALGSQGMHILQKVIEYSADVPVILDHKMGDIFSTGTAYAHAAFEYLKASCATVNAYMGGDAVKPFLRCAFTYWTQNDLFFSLFFCKDSVQRRVYTV